MNPEQPISINPKEAKYLRTIITVGLVLVLLAIVAAYIYYGMQLAKQGDTATNTDATQTEMTPDQVDIVKALETAPVASPERVEAVVNALEAAPDTSATDQQAIIDALQ